METRRDYILGLMEDTVADLLYYDRKEDDTLPRGAIEEAIAKGEVTVEEIARHFERHLREGISQ